MTLEGKFDALPLLFTSTSTPRWLEFDTKSDAVTLLKKNRNDFIFNFKKVDHVLSLENSMKQQFVGNELHFLPISAVSCFSVGVCE